MPTLPQFVAAHWAVISFVTAYAFVAAVEAMPDPGDPRPLGAKLYQWAYDVLHLLMNKTIERKPALAPPQEKK